MSKLMRKKALDIVEYWYTQFPKQNQLKVRAIGIIAHDHFLLKNS